MKKLIYTCLFLVPVAHAQVVECPKFYPTKDTIIYDAPDQRKGQGVVAKQQLSGAGLNVGEFKGGGDIHGLRKDRKGGYEIHFGIWAGPKWLVCDYGPNQGISWWQRLDDIEGDCRLKVVKRNAEGSMTATLSCDQPKGGR